MMVKHRGIWVLVSVLLLGLIACRNVEVRESEPEVKGVRIIDVEEQDDEDFLYKQHYARAGMIKFASGFDYRGEVDIPFANQMRVIEKETGIEINYVMLKGWDELPAELEEAKRGNVTTIVLFNNSYDGSLIREADSGKYADMEETLRDFGFYEEEAYNQEVLKAGMTKKGQTLVPILYNVSGMIQGDMDERYDYEIWKEMAYQHAENATLDYESFLEQLKTSMRNADRESVEIPFLSAAFLEGKVDMFLMASGADLTAYENQEELFTLLYHYLKCYYETQAVDGGSYQEWYGQYIKDYEEVEPDPDRYLSEEVAKRLKLPSYGPDSSLSEIQIDTLIDSMFERTEYFVECSAADDVAYHSIFGLLAYRNKYVSPLYIGEQREKELEQPGNMNYWPIGILNSETEYAAQPICYAAVVEGSNKQLAAEMLQSLMNQPTNVAYGISVCNQSKDAQLEEWKGLFQDPWYRMIRGQEERQSDTTTKWEKVEVGLYSYFGSSLQTFRTNFIEDRGIYTSQVAKQIDNIVVARIPDREVLAIWQDTLTEAVDSGLSAEAGFKLLCDRMEKRSLEE